MGVLLQLFQQKPPEQLTEAQRKMYAAEKLENFRWISKLVATYSNHELTEGDVVAEELILWLREIGELHISSGLDSELNFTFPGQFAEVAYSPLPLESLHKNYDTLNRYGFPFEGYYALSPHPYPSSLFPISGTGPQACNAVSSGVRLLKTLKGNVANLPGSIFSRWIHGYDCPKIRPASGRQEIQTAGECEPKRRYTKCNCPHKHQQIIVSICGTASAQQAIHDLRAIRRTHPGVCDNTATVHAGFWDLYQGMKSDLIEGIEAALRIDPADDEIQSDEDATNGPDTGNSEDVVRELVITGHSMGGAIAHLLCIDLLSPSSGPPRPASSRSSTFAQKSSSRSQESCPQDLLISLTCERNPPKCDVESKLQNLGLKHLEIITFGEPRTGNQALVDHWRAIKKSHEEEHSISVREWCLKGYNDGMSPLLLWLNSVPIVLGYAGVPALPLHWFGYRHFAQQPLYTVNGKVYRIPKTESESALFRVTPSSSSQPSDPSNPLSRILTPVSQSSQETTDPGTATATDKAAATACSPLISLYPLGGHNYYSGRDLEGGLLRRLDWLVKSGFDKDGWEDKYRTFMEKHFT